MVYFKLIKRGQKRLNLEIKCLNEDEKNIVHNINIKCYDYRNKYSISSYA